MEKTFAFKVMRLLGAGCGLRPLGGVGKKREILRRHLSVSKKTQRRNLILEVV